MAPDPRRPQRRIVINRKPPRSAPDAAARTGDLRILAARAVITLVVIGLTALIVVMFSATPLVIAPILGGLGCVLMSVAKIIRDLRALPLFPGRAGTGGHRTVSHRQHVRRTRPNWSTSRAPVRATPP
jgi:hypothetical protein